MPYLFSVFFLLWSPFSYGNFLQIEPYVGYGVMVVNEKPLDIKEIKITESIDYVTSSKYYQGILGGLRLGYSNLGLSLGLDVTAGRLNHDKSTLATLFYGPYISYKLPLLFRIYGTLIVPKLLNLSGLKSFDNILSRMLIFPKNKDDLQEKITCDIAGGVKVGVSYLSIPFLSINFEYQPLRISGEDCGSNKGFWTQTLTAYLNLTF